MVEASVRARVVIAVAVCGEASILKSMASSCGNSCARTFCLYTHSIRYLPSVVAHARSEYIGSVSFHT